MEKSEKKHDIYLASGWFTPNQNADIKNFMSAISKLNLRVFSPQAEFVCPPDADSKTQSKVFELNKEAIQNSNLVLAITTDKDMGTLWEAGYAYGKGIPVVYFSTFVGGKFNLMLAKSGVSAIMTTKALRDFMVRYDIAITTDFSLEVFFKSERRIYDGLIE